MITAFFALLSSMSLVAAPGVPPTRAHASSTNWGRSVTVKKRPFTAPTESSDVTAKRPKIAAVSDQQPADTDGDAPMADAPAPVPNQPQSVVDIPSHPEMEMKQAARTEAQVPAAEPAQASAPNSSMTDVAQKEAHQNPCNDLMILLDPIGGELRSESGSLTEILAQNFFYRFGPMLVSGSLIQNYIHRVRVAQKNIAEHKKTGKSPEAWITSNNPIPWLVDQALLQASPAKWRWFIHKQANLVLCIPEDYLAKHYPNGLTIYDQIAQAGFAVRECSEWVETTQETFLKHIMTLDVEAPILQPIMSCFSTNVSTPWNILISGHGTNALLGSNKELHEIIKKGLLLQIAVAEKIPEIKNILNYLNRELKQLERRLDLLQQNPQKIIPATSEICGLDFDQFIALVTHLNKLNIVHLHCKTCCVGGYNREFIRQSIATLDPKFIFTLPGGCDGEIYDVRAVHSENHWTWDHDYGAFFKDFRSLMHAVAQKQSPLDGLGKALFHLYSSPQERLRYGYFYNQKNKEFLPLSYGCEGVEYLSEEDAKQANQFVVKAQEALIIQSQNVQTPIEFKNYCPIFCMSRNIADSTVTLRFKEIRTPLTMQQFMRSLVRSCHHYPHRFLIERFFCTAQDTRIVLMDIDLSYHNKAYSLSCRIPQGNNKCFVYQADGKFSPTYEMGVTGFQCTDENMQLVEPSS